MIKRGDIVKRIGVIIPAITDRLQSELLDGIYKTASSAGYDVIVLTTATNGLEFHIQNEIMEGEESIYKLIERAELSGILLASQYFIKETVRVKISDIIKKTAIPCIDLGGTELGYETVCISQDKAVYNMTEHVIVKHECKKLIFLAGFIGNPDSEQRLSGFLRAVEKYNCIYEIVYGDFWKIRAAELADELIHHKRPMPDAVICASDVMAVTLCNELQEGGISVPEDIIITGFDGHISAISNFPSITTISGAIYELGCIGAAKLIEISDGKSPQLPESCMNIIYGASCGCAKRMDDYETAAKKIHDQIRRDAEAGEMLEMRINADVITRASCVESLTDLIALTDGTAHTIKNYNSLHMCILPDWDADPEHPDSCITKPYPEKMACVLSKTAWNDGKNEGIFPTSQIVPMLSQPHSPTLLFVLPLHASSQVFGYMGLEYKNASDFTVSVMLFDLMSSLANGMRILRHKLYAEYLQKKLEEASLYDKMTDMLSKKGLLLYLEKQEQSESKNGIMLVTISKLSAASNGQTNNRLSDTVMQSELILANAIRLISGRELQTARLDKRTFAVVYPLKNTDTPEHFAEEMMLELEVLIKKMQEGSAAAFLPEPYHVCGYVTAPAEKCISELWDNLNSNQPKEKGFTGIGQFKRIRREMHKAPELDWNLTELSKRLNISKSYVQKLYKENFGISYIDDLIDARISMAKQLLTTTDLRISEVASSCGYQNATHFMRQFKNKTGISPSEFRNNSL